MPANQFSWDYLAAEMPRDFDPYEIDLEQICDTAIRARRLLHDCKLQAELATPEGCRTWLALNASEFIELIDELSQAVAKLWCLAEEWQGVAELADGRSRSLDEVLKDIRARGEE